MSIVTPTPTSVTLPNFGSEILVPQRRKLFAEEIEQIQSIKPRDMIYPEPITWSEHTKSAAVASNEWVRTSHLEGMYRSPKVMQKHLAQNLSDLLLWVLPGSGERESVLIGKYTVWGFALDDYFEPDDRAFDQDEGVRVLCELNLLLMWSFPDEPLYRNNLEKSLEGEVAEKRIALLKYVNEKLAVARHFPGTVYDTSTERTHALVRGLGELWTEMEESAPRQYLLRWGVATQRFINCFFVEVYGRKNPEFVPSVHEYVLMRRESVGLYAYSLLCEYAENKFLPYDLFYSPEMDRFMDSSSDCGAWVNDFCSLYKEASKGDLYNLVIIVQREQNGSFHEAFETAWEMLSNRIEDMERDHSAVKLVTPPEYESHMELYLQTCRNFVWTAHLWYSQNGRYNDYKETCAVD